MSPELYCFTKSLDYSWAVVPSSLDVPNLQTDLPTLVLALNDHFPGGYFSSSVSQGYCLLGILLAVTFQVTSRQPSEKRRSFTKLFSSASLEVGKKFLLVQSECGLLKTQFLNDA